MSIGNGRGKNVVRVAGGRFAEDIGTGFASQDIIEHGFEHFYGDFRVKTEGLNRLP